MLSKIIIKIFFIKKKIIIRTKKKEENTRNIYRRMFSFDILQLFILYSDRWCTRFNRSTGHISGTNIRPDVNATTPCIHSANARYSGAWSRSTTSRGYSACRQIICTNTRPTSSAGATSTCRWCWFIRWTTGCSTTKSIDNHLFKSRNPIIHNAIHSHVYVFYHYHHYYHYHYYYYHH